MGPDGSQETETPSGSLRWAQGSKHLGHLLLLSLSQVQQQAVQSTVVGTQMLTSQAAAEPTALTADPGSFGKKPSLN